MLAADDKNRGRGNTPAKPSTRVEICVVEGDRDHPNSIAGVLRSAGYKVVAAEQAAQALDLIRSEHPKLIVCDYHLSADDGLWLCSQVRSIDAIADTYFILMAGEQHPDLRVVAWQAGVDDFLTKPVAPDSLLAQARIGIRFWCMQERLRNAATLDGLTRLSNHDHFTKQLDRENSRARRYGRTLSLIMMDLDFFKAINDTFGHLVGNEVLVEVARILRECAREVDIIARYGGEEFAVLLPETASETAANVARRIRENLHRGIPIPTLGEHILTASFGIADTDDVRVNSAVDLINLADQALYAAKHRGRDRIILASEIQDADNRGGAPLGNETEIEALRKRVAFLNTQTKDIHLQSIACLIQVLEEKDPFTARHSLNVSWYAEQIARQMGQSASTVRSVRNAGLLHDIGKVGIPDRILLKRGPLNEVEKLMVAQVPYMSARIVDPMRILDSELEIIRHQREFFDGSGYPDGLAGEEIPLGSRILMVADAFDAVTTDRVYRSRLEVDKAIAALRPSVGKQFDLRVFRSLEQSVHLDRAKWEQRIQETVNAFQLPLMLAQTRSAL